MEKRKHLLRHTVGSIKLISVYVLYDEAVTDIDTSGIHALEELYGSLKKREIQVKSAQLVTFFICNQPIQIIFIDNSKKKRKETRFIIGQHNNMCLNVVDNMRFQ